LFVGKNHLALILIPTPALVTTAILVFKNLLLSFVQEAATVRQKIFPRVQAIALQSIHTSKTRFLIAVATSQLDRKLVFVPLIPLALFQEFEVALGTPRIRPGVILGRVIGEPLLNWIGYQVNAHVSRMC